MAKKRKAPNLKQIRAANKKFDAQFSLTDKIISYKTTNKAYSVTTYREGLGTAWSKRLGNPPYCTKGKP